MIPRPVRFSVLVHFLKHTKSFDGRMAEGIQEDQ